VPLAHLSELALQKSPRVERLIQTLGKVLSRSAATRQPAGLEEGGLHRNVSLCLFEALLHGSDRVSNLKSEIPAGTHKPFVGLVRIGYVRSQQQQIHIGIRVHFAAPVSADGDERGVRWDREDFEQYPQGVICGERKLPQEAPRLSVLVKLLERRIA
jgi:hypothetical protein